MNPFAASAFTVLVPKVGVLTSIIWKMIADLIQRLHDAFKIAMLSPAHVQEIAKYDQELSYLGHR